MSDWHIRPDCRLCHSTDLEELLRLNPTPLANEYPETAEGSPREPVFAGFPPHVATEPVCQDRFPLYLVGCRACGHVQLPVVVDPKRLFPPTYPYASGTSPVFRAHLQSLADELMCILDPPGQYGTSHTRHLDIACNDGTLVEMVRAHNRLSHGIDPASPQREGYTRGFFTEAWARAAAADGDRYDVITMLNAFAHIDDLSDVVRGVKILLEPGGLFVIEVGYLRDVVENSRFSVLYHEHLDVHHIAPLVGFFARHGMTLTDAERIDSQGGSIRLFVRNGDGEQSGRLRALLAEENRAELWEGVRRLSDAVQKAGEQIRASAPVVMYGAPAKLCTLLHATGTTDCVEWVADDNPNKVGRFVPGSRIPIVPVSKLYEQRPKRVMITAWNFAADVMRKHAELGCDWVVSHG